LNSLHIQYTSLFETLSWRGIFFNWCYA